jgi:ribonuclease BN (tRNA processing enzyme)
MKIRVLGAHNCEYQDSRFVCLLIDDVLAVDAGALSSSLSLESQQELRTILLTHQHYDHVRDVPAVAINRFFHKTSINIYSTKIVLDTITTHLLNGMLYPEFTKLPEMEPTIRFTILEPYKPELIEGYSVLAVPVNHSKFTVGYQITSLDGRAMFYTADTGPGLSGCWQTISPQLLIAEVTVPNRQEELAIKSGHLTPALLARELTSFRELKDYLPQVIGIHMDPVLEEEIRAEITEVSKVLNTSITLAHEGMELHLE